MRKVLRSIVFSESKDDSRTPITDNIPVLIETPLAFVAPEDREIWDYVESYFRAYGKAPSFGIVLDQFDRKGKDSVIDRIEDIETIDEPFTGPDFEELVGEYFSDQKNTDALKTLRDAGIIIQNGLEVQYGPDTKELEGAQDAFDYLLGEADNFLFTDGGGKLRGEVTQDADGMLREFESTLRNPRGAWGVITLLDAIDAKCRGIKPGELWLHAAFTSELKCLAGDAEVYDHGTQMYRRVDEIYRSGDLPEVTALENEGDGRDPRLLRTDASHLKQNGERKVWDLHLSDGSSIGATENHRFLTPQGWAELGDLERGDTVAVPTGGDPGFEGGGVAWSSVASISYRGVEMTYDLEVPEHHTFVANDIITHNTTFALNWAWKAVTCLRYNVYFFSLEMPYEQVRRIIYVLHSNHPKFKQQGYDPLDYRVIRDGVHEDGSPISDREKELFYKVCRDFQEREGEEYGRFIVERPSSEADIPYIKQRMEMAHRQQPIDVGFIDYLGLVEPSKKTRDFYTGMNSILREAKQLALNFNKGEGVGLVCLHQMNREGKEHADKNDGRYRLQGLADANEAERSSDVVTYTYLNDDLRKEEETKIGCLKNRDNPHFDQFHATVDFPSRFIGNSTKAYRSMDAADDKLDEIMDGV